MNLILQQEQELAKQRKVNQGRVKMKKYKNQKYKNNEQRMSGLLQLECGEQSEAQQERKGMSREDLEGHEELCY